MIVKTYPLGSLQTNCYLVIDENTNKAAVIDPGAEASYLIKEIEALGIKIEVILLTHCHFDHNGAVEELKDKYNDVCVGAGTVLSKDNVDECIENGTDFIVSPCLDEEVIGYANQRKVLVIPGLMTMSELNRAYKMGLRFIKVFPGSVVGKGFIGAAKSIFNDICIMPTGGVKKENIVEWINAGADCSGIGSDLNKIYKTDGAYGVKEYCRLVKEEVKKTEK